jgi:glutathionyl-hydroquinone reductase
MTERESLFPARVVEAEEGDVCMVFNAHGNAFLAFDYTPERLREEADRMERVVTLNDNPFGAVLS